MDKISHWIIMEGNPTYTGKTRQTARNTMKIKNRSKDYYLYIGKVIDDPKRRGHGKIVLEY